MALAFRLRTAATLLLASSLIFSTATTPKAFAAGGDLLATIANPIPEEFEFFGSAIATVGTNLVVGAPLNDFGLGSVYLVDGTTGGVIRTIDNPEPATSDGFGSAVAPLGANILVGSPYSDADGQDSGRVYLFNASNGALLLTIVDPSPESGGNFGASVAAVSGNILVGAPNKAGGGLGRGAAYLFNTSGALLFTFADPNPSDGSSFGTVVTASGSNYLISAPGETISGFAAAGSVYLFDSFGTLQTTIPNPAPGSLDFFGQSLAVTGSTFVIGAPFDSTLMQAAGSVYVFSSAGALQYTIPNPGPAVFEGFGSSVAANASYILVGNPLDDDGGSGAGSVSVYDRATGAHMFHLGNPDPQLNDQFGASLAIVNGNFAVGAPWDDSAGYTEAGVAYIFDGTGTFPTPTPSPTPSLSPTVTPSPTPTPGPNDPVDLFSTAPRALGRFGEAISGIGDVNGNDRGDVVVGAPGESDAPQVSTTREGRVYLLDGTTGQPIFSLRSPNESDYGNFGTSVGGIGDLTRDCASEFLIGAPGEEPGLNPVDSGAAYIWNGGTGQPERLLTSPSPEPGGAFGYSISGVSDVNGDNHPDVIVGALYEDGGTTPTVRRGRAHLFSGETGTLLRTFDSPNPLAEGRFGWAVSGVPDLDGDSQGDVAISAPAEDGVTFTRAGRAYIFSGATGFLLHTLSSTGERSTGSFGHSIAGIGDVNNDGKGDVIVGASAEPATASGRVYVFSGATGLVLRVLQAGTIQNAAFFGFAVAATSDMDGDGAPDILASAIDEDIPTSDAGRVYLYSGATGALLQTLQSLHPAPHAGFGFGVAGVRDFTSVGRSYAALAAHYEASFAPTSGRGYIYKANAPAIATPTPCIPSIPSAVGSWAVYE